VSVSYPVDWGLVPERELPFVIGVLGDFAGDPTEPPKPLSERSFAEIDVDNFDDRMARIAPGLDLRVPDMLAGDGSELAVRLEFRSIPDFGPARVAEQVPALKALLGERAGLCAPMASADRPEGHGLRSVAELDRRISGQLNAVMHHPRFLRLEGSWRGLHYLVMHSETGPSLKIRVLNASKRDLQQDLSPAEEFEQGQLFRKIHAEEFGTPSGQPYGALIGDYEWDRSPEDVGTLRPLSRLAAACFAPFISAAGPGMLGLRDWRELPPRPRDVAEASGAPDHAAWCAFRDGEESRFVALVMPRVLARPTAPRPARPRSSATRRRRRTPPAAPRRWSTSTTAG
jgi:type VI secretion system ImpB/VipA family protein